MSQPLENICFVIVHKAVYNNHNKHHSTDTEHSSFRTCFLSFFLSTPPYIHNLYLLFFIDGFIYSHEEWYDNIINQSCVIKSFDFIDFLCVFFFFPSPFQLFFMSLTYVMLSQTGVSGLINVYKNYKHRFEHSFTLKHIFSENNSAIKRSKRCREAEFCLLCSAKW